MFVIHRGDRTALYNVSKADKIRLQGVDILIIHEIYGNTTCLKFETDEDAKKAFGYLIEGLKRKDGLVTL